MPGLDHYRGLVSDADVRVHFRRRDGREDCCGSTKSRWRMRSASGFNQMSGSRQMAVGAATHMRSMQAGFRGAGRDRRGGARAARHRRHAEFARRPLRHIQHVYPHADAGLGRDRRRTRHALSVARPARLQGLACVRLHARDQHRDSAFARRAPIETRRHRHDSQSSAAPAPRSCCPSRSNSSAGPSSASTAIQYPVHDRGRDGAWHGRARDYHRRGARAIPRCSRWPTA